MFTKQEKSVLDLISGHQVLLKKRLVQQCDSLSSAKTDVEDFKERPSFTQNNNRPEDFEHKCKGTEFGKGTKFNKRGKFAEN